jgi:hypothetical protein
MRVIHNEYDQHPKSSNKLHMFFCILLILSVMYLISLAVTSVPGTYAWLTSETEASGTITNATTEDLLSFQSSKIRYGEQCSMKHTLKMKNTSNMNTTVTVSLSIGNGYEKVAEQQLKPGQKMIVKPDISEKNCGASALDYRIQAFHHYVDETYEVAIDQEKLKARLEPEIKEKAEAEPAQPVKNNKEEKTIKEDYPQRAETPSKQPNIEKSVGDEVEGQKEPTPGEEALSANKPLDGEESRSEMPSSDQKMEKDGQIPETVSLEKGTKAGASTDEQSSDGPVEERRK